MEGFGKQAESKEKKGELPTIYDVAQKAGVSFVSVSRVLNGHANVSEDMRRRVFAAARDLGYRARLVTRPDMIGILVREEHDPGRHSDLNLLCRYLCASAAKRNFLTRVVLLEEIGQLIRYGIRGIVELGLENHTLCDPKLMPKVPVVLTQHRHTGNAWMSVLVDYCHEARLAIGAMLRKGHRGFTVLMPDRNAWTTGHRIEALKEALAKHGLTSNALSIRCGTSVTLTQLEAVIRKTGSTCLINFDHDRTLKLLDHLFNRSNLRVPEDLGLLTLDNTDVCAHYHPRVSGIRQPLDKIAENAIATLADTSQNGGMKSAIILHRSTLQLRRTTPNLT